MLVSRSSLEKVSPADRFRRTTSPSRLVTVRSPCSRTRSISARASVDLPLPDRPVKNSTRPCSSRVGPVGVDDRPRSSAGRLGRSELGGREGEDRVGAGVVGAPPGRRARGRPRRRRARPAGPRPPRRRAGARPRPGGADQRHRGELGGARCRPARAARPGPPSAQPVELRPRSSGVDDRDERAAGVLLAGLGGGEVEPAERAELRVGERRDRPLAAARAVVTRPAAAPRGRPARPRPAPASVGRAGSSVTGLPGSLNAGSGPARR